MSNKILGFCALISSAVLVGGSDWWHLGPDSATFVWFIASILFGFGMLCLVLGIVRSDGKMIVRLASSLRTKKAERKRTALKRPSSQEIG